MTAIVVLAYLIVGHRHHLAFLTLRHNRQNCVAERIAGFTLRSHLAVIAPMIRKLKYFSDITNDCRRHLGFRRNVIIVTIYIVLYCQIW